MIAVPAGIEVGEDELQRALRRQIDQGLGTGNRRILLRDIVARVFDAARRVQTGELLRLAYSVKTNPSREILGAARDAGMYAEVISPQELEHARDCGFSADEIIYNGPHPARYCCDRPGYVFADSMEAFADAARRFANSLVGVRIRPPRIPSRFGVPFDRLDELCSVIREERVRRLGVSFHVRPEDYGEYDFRGLWETVLRFCAELERRSGAAIVAFDAGGGKRPAELDRMLREGVLETLISQAAHRLHHLRNVLLEPGQALAAPCEAVIATILEVRRSQGTVDEIVVDAGYPDLPQIHSYPHRVFWLRKTEAHVARAGRGRVLGNTCLEYDVLCEGVELEGCRIGDSLAIADAGAYDASMSFKFARGSRSL